MTKVVCNASPITALKPHLDKLIENKYRISEKIYLQVLQEAGEI